MTGKTKIVSVCMITYNHEKYIKQAIDSILMQNTNFEYELVIANDNSPDKTHEIILEYILHHPQGLLINYIRNENNVGAMQNFLIAINACNGKYIALCEGDDYWIDPNKLQKQVDLLESNPGYSLCFHDALMIWENKNRPPELFCSKNQGKASTMEEVIKKWFIPSASMVFKRELIIPLPEWFKDVYSGDYALQMILAYKGDFLYLDDIMSVYRRHLGSLSASADERQKFINDKKITLFKIVDEFTQYKYHAEFVKRIQYFEKKYNQNWIKKIGRRTSLFFRVKFKKILMQKGLFIIRY